MHTLPLLATLVALVLATCPVNPNVKPTIQAEPILLDTTLNGEKYVLGDINSTDRLFVAKLKGTHYEMGKAFGALFKNEIKLQLAAFFDYYGSQLEKLVESKLPKFLAEKVTGGAIDVIKRLMDLNIIITKKYTKPRYYEEINGIAAGAGMDASDLKRLNILPELIKAACTVAGIWGPASRGGHTLHMRALDWENMLPISRFPVAVYYQPSDPALHPHVNLAWVGFVGSLTGISEKLSLGEKVWLPKKGSVPMTRYGNPWTYVFRDVLYDAHDLSSAMKILETTHRTCAIHIGLASLDDHSFRMMEYSYKTLNVYDDKNYDHYAKNHPQKDGIAFFDKHVQPSGDDCVGSLVTNSHYYADWTAEDFWRVVGNSHETGNTQLVVFDLEERSMFVSYSEYGTGLDAFRRRPFQLSLEWLMDKF